jgi:mono/diheme cytochrome c family protein
MNRLVVSLLGSSLLVLVVAAEGRQGQAPASAPAPKPAAPAAAAPAAPRPAATHAAAPALPGMSAANQTQVVTQYCATCHSDKAKAGGLSLSGWDAMKAQEQPEVVEKMIRKLRAGMMPPAGAKRPDDATIAALTTGLEARMDEFAAANPNPGWRPFQRLTRAEYEHAIRDLLDIDVDVSPYLPADTISHGFDNIADAQGFSPALLDGYLRAAGQVSRLALGDKQAAPTSVTYRIPNVESQMRYVDGAPFGSRGGVVATHIFPADGTFVFHATMVRTISGELFGNTSIAMAGKNELLEISIDGERVAVLEINPRMSDATSKGLSVESPPIQVKAGPHRVAAAFIPRFTGPVDDLMAPIDHTLVDTRIGTGFGVTALPHLEDLTISGPMKVTGMSDTPSRRKVYTCRPTSAAEETPCATQILKKFATQAYRGSVDAKDFADIMAFYEQGRKDGGDFEAGIRLAVQSVLANPRFLFRFEAPPTTTATAKAAPKSYRVGDLELASRLSYFLWGAGPDEELLKLAGNGTLRTAPVFEKQVRRMLADPRAEALATRFGSQWLRLQDVEKVRPDGILYPYWDKSLSEAFVKETQLFFDSIVREDHSVLDLITGDWSFVNERLARHYGIPNVYGSDFRRVTLPESRRGILTQGSILLQTSVADRTSPVQRGKWVMQVMLGSPPPAPPPNVPSLDESVKATTGGKILSVRERMEQHRSNPACNSCHRVIDPLGLALENYDVTGRYRIKDSGVPVDSTGELYDGSRFDGAAGLRSALVRRKDVFLLSFTESLMTYGLGRRVEPFDMPTIRGIIRDAAKADYKFSSFVLGIVNSPAFRMSRPPPPQTTGAAGAPP